MTWFVQTALGLHYMHSNRVLHRDIKTQNVFILSSGRVVLGDLGISKVRSGAVASVGEHAGCRYVLQQKRVPPTTCLSLFRGNGRCCPTESERPCFPERMECECEEKH